MAYKAPYLDAAGIHTPEYADILAYLITAYQGIFGSDIYLGTDTQDYQMLSLFASAYNDAMSALNACYTSHNPDYASGSALDLLLPLNGLTRNEATASEAVLTLTGLPNATLPENLLARDVQGRTWRIPNRVTLDSNGNASVAAYCQDLGAVQAAAGEISEMLTPQAYWYSVTNPSPATAGMAVETDAHARLRRENSVSLPSRAIIDGIKAALLNISGIERIAVYENKTGETDGKGLPPHCICAVCEGGDEEAIAKAIYLKKSPGCGCFGTTAVNIQDSYGDTMAVSFFRPEKVAIHVSIILKPLSGWDAGMLTLIKEAVAGYARTVPIGGQYVVSYLWPLVFSAVGVSPPPFSIKSVIARIGENGTPHIDNIALLFNQAAYGNASSVTVLVEG